MFILFLFQVKVREATSNDPWGPSSTMMSEIADLTYNVVAFTEIMQMIWKRLNDHGKNWRHVYKALVLLEYLIKTGSEKVRKTRQMKGRSALHCSFMKAVRASYIFWRACTEISVRSLCSHFLNWERIFIYSNEFDSNAKVSMFDIRIVAFMDLIQKVDIESPQEPEVVDMIFQSVFLHSRKLIFSGQNSS